MENELVVLEEKGKEIKKETLCLVARATKFQITNDADNQKAASILANIAKTKREAEVMRISFTKPLNESLRNINSFFKKLNEPLEKATSIIKGKVKEYYFKQEEITRKHAEEKKEEVKKPEITTRSMFGDAMTVKSIWKWEIVNRKAIPSQYYKLDEKAIDEAVRAGARDIPGIHVYQDKLVSVRPKSK